MTVELNHTIVPARDKHASAAFLSGILGVPVSPGVAHFVPINLGNGVTLDYDDARDPQPHHYAFLVSEDVFDAAFKRVTAAGIPYHADPGGGRPGEIYQSGPGGRGFYFEDPDGHLMELLTRDLSGRQASD
jgi:catechol 2,3-dioxygenase-like lactoylglutathione lyase family enzyme